MNSVYKLYGYSKSIMELNMKVKFLLSMVSFIIFLLSSDVFALDGNRKGFIIGIGAA